MAEKNIRDVLDFLWMYAEVKGMGLRPDAGKEVFFNEALSEIKEILMERIKGMRRDYLHNENCACIGCVHRVVRNITLEKVEDMIAEELK